MFKTRNVAAVVLSAFLAHSVALPAHAQTEDPLTMQARTRFKEGVDFYDKGKYEDARLAFLQAYTLKKHPAVLLNLAQSSGKAGHSLEGARYFQQFLRESPNATPQQRRDAEAGLAEVRQKLGQIVVVAPAGTEVSLDEQGAVGTAPFADVVDVEPGAHVLKSKTETVRVVATIGQRVEAKFGGATTPTPPPVVAPAAVTPAPADPAAPPPPPATPPGADTGPKRTNLLTPPETMTPVYIGLAAAGVGLVGAVVFALFRADAQEKADQNAADIRNAANATPGLSAQGVCSNTNTDVVARFGPACNTLKDNNDKVDTNATIANVSLVVMGLGLVTAGAWYLLGPKPDDPKPSTAASRDVPVRSNGPTRVVVTPFAGHETGGLLLRGTF